MAIAVRFTPDTQRLVRTLRIIAKHLEALAVELEALEAEESDAND